MDYPHAMDPLIIEQARIRYERAQRELRKITQGF
jgi:hypothetical protein